MGDVLWSAWSPRPSRKHGQSDELPVAGRRARIGCPPDASKILYKGPKLNDALTKIITQKYIANVPYGVVETWNDRRRLGLPFFESPVPKP